MRGNNSAGMQVRVNKVTLLNKLRENREKHVVAHAEALAGYRVAVRKEIEGWLKLLDGGKSLTALCLNNREPQSFVSEYDAVIGMLELSTDSELPLDQQQYQQFINDDWGWKDSWVASNSGYLQG